MKTKNTMKYVKCVAVTSALCLIAAKCDSGSPTDETKNAGAAQTDPAQSQTNAAQFRSDDAQAAVAAQAEGTTKQASPAEIRRKKYEEKRKAEAEEKARWERGDFDPTLSPEELNKEKVRAYFKFGQHNHQKAHDLGPDAVPFLLDIIANPDSAAEIVGKDKTRENYRNMDAVQDAINALGSIGDKRAVEPIIDWLESEDKKAPRREMSLNGHLADALGHLAGQGNDRALKYLMEILKSENWNKHWRNYDVLGVSTAIMSLAISGRPEAKAEFEKMRNLLNQKKKNEGELTGVNYEVVTTLESAFVAWEEVQILGLFGYTNQELRKAKGLDKGGRGVP